MISAVINQIAEEMKGVAKIGKVDVADNMKLAVAHKVSMLPTLLIFKNGQEVVRFHLQGASKNNIIAHLKACL